MHVCWFSPAGKILQYLDKRDIQALTQQSFSNIAIDVHGKLAQSVLSIGNDFCVGAYLQ